MSDQATIIAKMMNGEPFTYGGLCAWRRKFVGAFQHGDHDRLIDRTIQKLRREGKIAFERKGRLTIWRMIENEGKDRAKAETCEARDE